MDANPQTEFVTDSIARRQAEFERSLTELKQNLKIAGYHRSLEAIDFAQPHHQGLRKDGVTPSFFHQTRVALSLYDVRFTMMAAGLDADEMITVGILHDTPEENENIMGALREKFGERIADRCWQISKVRNGQKVPIHEYYPGLLRYPEILFVKLHDRADNVATIIHLPSHKQPAYVLETIELLKVAKHAINQSNAALHEALYAGDVGAGQSVIWPVIQRAAKQSVGQGIRQVGDHHDVWVSLVELPMREIERCLEAYMSGLETAARGDPLNEIVAAFRKAKLLGPAVPGGFQPDMFSRLGNAS